MTDAELNKAVEAGLRHCDLYDVASQDIIGRNHLRRFLAGAFESVAKPAQPRLLTGCLRDGVCRGVCRTKDCPNYDMVVAARLVVEPKQDGVVYPEDEAFRLNPYNRQQREY